MERRYCRHCATACGRSLLGFSIAAFLPFFHVASTLRRMIRPNAVSKLPAIIASSLPAYGILCETVVALSRQRVLLRLLRLRHWRQLCQKIWRLFCQRSAYRNPLGTQKDKCTQRHGMTDEAWPAVGSVSA
ncbi:unnamed protein product [Caenorhabditis auriculariae]|uniref:Transmembrane protein n=1 Tax=Caenorhabditis auriculariae TaxID=2777116 RepID=A0A8S1GXT1_9PELO|nr:unnamed protein product [Caenorhabditis auriculariae]